MKHSRFLLTCLLVVQASAQSSDLLSILVSQGYSILTSITASLGQTATNTPTILATSDFPSTASSVDLFSGTSTDSFASATPSATSAQTTPTGSSSASITSQTTPASPVSSVSGTNPSGTPAAASATSPAADSGGSHRDRNLAIILGTVLGALALGLFILLLLILCRRRRRRAYGRGGSLSSTSDEALAGRKGPNSHIAPIAAANTSRRRSLLRHNNAKHPQMSEHSRYDVPSAHRFENDDTVPFVPTGGSNHSSGAMPTNTRAGLGSGSHLRDGTGLNNHPYHDNHHTGSVLAAGAGGAALGAAAARHSRSTERHHQSRLSGEPGTHPAFWDEPPPQSSQRNSIDSARRSGSMPRGPLYGPQDHATSPLRNNLSATAAGGTTGMAAGALADRAGRRSHDRGRSLHPDVAQSKGHFTATTPVGSHGMTNVVPGLNNNSANVVHSGPVPLRGQGHIHSHDHSHGAMAPAVGAAVVGADMAKHNRSRSRSGPNPALPPSLVIGDSNHRRNMPSRSPKRTRFSNGHTYHDAMPYENEAINDGGISPPTTAKSTSFNPTINRISGNSTATDELVSPISPEDQPSGTSHFVPIPLSKGNSASTRRNRSFSPNRHRRVSDSSPPSSVSPLPRATLGPKGNQHMRVNDLSPPSSVSPQPPGPLPPTVVTTTTTTIRPTPTPRQDSGLLHAVSDQFDSNTTSSTQQYTTSDYQAFAQPDTQQTKGFKPVSRKPVPFSPYIDARPAYNDGFGPHPERQRQASGSGEPRSSGENWWRGEEDSAWQQSYSPPNQQQHWNQNQNVGYAK